MKIGNLGTGIIGILFISTLVGIGFTVGQSVTQHATKKYLPDYAMQVRLAEDAASRAYFAGNRVLKFANYHQ